MHFHPTTQGIYYQGLLYAAHVPELQECHKDIRDFGLAGFWLLPLKKRSIEGLVNVKLYALQNTGTCQIATVSLQNFPLSSIEPASLTALATLPDPAKLKKSAT